MHFSGITKNKFDKAVIRLYYIRKKNIKIKKQKTEKWTESKNWEI